MTAARASLVAIVVAVLCVSSGVAAAAGFLATLGARRVDGAVRVDGRLDDGAWSGASVAAGFTQEYPTYGAAATQPTEVRIAYDDRHLYVGARMSRAPRRGAIAALVHRRDRDSASDWFGIAIDSLQDRRTALEFRVNAAGVQRDVLIHSDDVEDDTWDGIWDSAVAVHADGWTAELRIPLSLLRIRNGADDQAWGINFVRVDQRPEERTRWHLVGRGENAFVSRFPTLVGLQALRPQARRELIPYVATQGKVATAQDFDDRGVDARVGVDAHIALGSSSLLDLSFLPDFGQTEVDQVILNLSTVETFFPEKRAFFLEGAETFQLNGPDLFYSRRIGRAAPTPDLAPGEKLLERPLAIDILGAAKLTGKYENGLNVGLLAAETEAAYAQVRQADGAIVARELAPTTNVGVARVLQQIGSNGSYLGGFSSLYHERSDAGRTAYVGAVDGTWKSSDRSMQVDGMGAYSAIGGDGVTHGAYGKAAAIKRWDIGWYLSSSATYASRDFQPNDVGFLPRADERTARVETGSQWDRTVGVFRNWGFYASGTYSEDHARRAFDKNLDGRFTTSFVNGWTAYVGGGVTLPVYDDRELRTFRDPVKKYLHRDTEPLLTAGVETSQASAWYASLDLSAENHPGGPSYSASLTQTFHPSSRIELELETEYLTERGELGWLETQGETPIVGLRRLRQLSQTVRASYSFTPQLTLQMFTQAFVASWNYRGLQSYVDDRRLAPGARAETTAFNERNWNVHLLFRWELQPGSTLYAVYTHGAADYGLSEADATLSARSIPTLLRAPSDDVLQLKLSWLFR